MMKTLFSLLLLLFVVNLVYSQTKNPNEVKKLVLNFESKTFTTNDLNKLKEGGFYQIEVSNINLNMYDISIHSKDTIYSKPLKTPMYSDINMDAINSLLSNLKSMASSYLVADSSQIFSIKADYKSTDESKDKIGNRLNGEIITLINFENQLRLLCLEVEPIILKINLCKLSAFSDEESLKAYNFKEALKTTELLKEKVIKLNKELATKKKEYDEFSAQNSDAISKNATWKEEDKKRKDGYNKLVTEASKLNNTLSTENVISLLKPLLFISPIKDSYVSLPQQLKGEQTDLTIKITPKKAEYNHETFETTIKFPNRLGYFSTGISFYRSGIVDERYSTKATPNSDTSFKFNIIKEDDQKAEIGITSIMRAGTKINGMENLGVHLSFGPGISISDKVKPRLLVGVGISYGDRHNLSIDGGVIYGLYSRKSNVYNLDEDYKIQPENITITSFEQGWFLSLGYFYAF